MSSSLEALINRPYTVQLAPEEQPGGEMVYIATHPDLPGCMGHGPTPDEAVADLADARRLYIETLVERGLDVPPPGSASLPRTV